MLLLGVVVVRVLMLMLCVIVVECGWLLFVMDVYIVMVGVVYISIEFVVDTYDGVFVVVVVNYVESCCCDIMVYGVFSCMCVSVVVVMMMLYYMVLLLCSCVGV